MLLMPLLLLLKGKMLLEKTSDALAPSVSSCWSGKTGCLLLVDVLGLNVVLCLTVVVGFGVGLGLDVVLFLDVVLGRDVVVVLGLELILGPLLLAGSCSIGLNPPVSATGRGRLGGAAAVGREVPTPCRVAPTATPTPWRGATNLMGGRLSRALTAN
jgi:hypothetical protein